MLTHYRKWLVMGLCIVCGLFVLGPVDSSQPWEEEVPWSAFERLAGGAHRATAAEVAEWLPRVDPHGQLGALIELEDNELVFHRAEEPMAPEVVLTLSGESRDGAESTRSDEGLKGLRVVLDPGHYGGVWAEAEQRHYEVEGRVPILEGNLTYATALNLGRLLHEEGATVWLTRGAPPREPIRYVDQRDFDLEREASLWLTHQQQGLTGLWKVLYPMRADDWALGAIKDSKITRSGPHLFALSDLRRRSELSNRCQADVTISIHYNASGNPDVNHLMVFMPGNFMPGELDSEASRYYALRQLVDGVLPTTMALGTRVARAMSARMGLVVRPASKKLNSLAIEQAPGVYARNLSVLKRTRGPVLLVEGPFMTNPGEYEKLMAPLSADEPAPRIRQLSEALLAALRASASELRALRSDEKELDTSSCAAWTPVW
mgnify:CR=1 FL=1